MESANQGTPGPKGVSAERVLEAAEALRQRLGKIPTVEQVRQELGTGSPSRIGDIMRPWRASLEPAVPVTAANDQVTKTLKTLTDLLCADITRHYQDRTERLTADNSTFQKELGRLEEDAIARQDELERTRAERDSLAATAKANADEGYRLRIELLQEKSAAALLERERDSLMDKSVRADQERYAASERIRELTDDLSRTRADRDSLAAQLDNAIVELAESEHRQRVRPLRPALAVRRIAPTAVSIGAIGRVSNRLRTLPAEIPKADTGGIE